MSQTLSKKEIAAAVGITPRTMQKHARDWSWLSDHACRSTNRPRFRREEVLTECRRRRLL